MPEICFEDLTPGQETAFGDLVVEREPMIAFAQEFDPQPFHVDEAAAAASPVGKLIASGWYTCGLQMRMLCDAWLLRSSCMGSPGIEEVRWLRPVMAGSRLTARQTILDRRVSKSRPGMGLVRFRLETMADGEPALVQDQLVMFGLRDAPPAGHSSSSEAPAAPQVAPAPAPRHVFDYEDVVLGETVPLGAYAFTRENVVSYARRFDPQPFHLSDEGAAASHFGRLAASGWHTAAAWMSCLVAHRKDTVSVAEAAGHPPPRYGVSPGFKNLKWVRPVFAGDTITFTTTATEKRISASRPGWGLVFSRNEGINARGETVFSFEGGGFWGRRQD